MKEPASAFDFTLSSADSRTGTSLYESLPVELEDEDQLLLIRVDVAKSAYQRANVKLTLTSSEIQSVLAGQTVKGHVSNWNQTMKVFEVYINQNSLFEDDHTDLLV